MSPASTDTKPVFRGDGTVNVTSFATLRSSANPPSQVFQSVALDTMDRQKALMKQTNKLIAMKIQAAQDKLEDLKEQYDKENANLAADEEHLSTVKNFMAHHNHQPGTLGVRVSLLEEDLQYRAALRGLDPESMVNSDRFKVWGLKKTITKGKREIRRLEAQNFNLQDERTPR